MLFDHQTNNSPTPGSVLVTPKLRAYPSLTLGTERRFPGFFSGLHPVGQRASAGTREQRWGERQGEVESLEETACRLASLCFPAACKAVGSGMPTPHLADVGAEFLEAPFKTPGQCVRFSGKN